MIYEIQHSTTYTYSRAVFLEPHTFRFRPRSDGAQNLLQFELRVEPKPSALTEYLDAEGNTVAHAWFEGTTPTLSIVTRSKVETVRANPFDFITDTALTQLPLRYDPGTERKLSDYLEREEESTSVDQFARALASGSAMDLQKFLAQLTTKLYERTKAVIREHGDPVPPSVTLGESVGTCRDLSVLFMDICRVMGIASRFVSGYQEGDANQDQRDLHAWAEVYLPGGGWRGFDPTHGLAVSDRHIAISASARAVDSSPVTGTFRGTGATARLETHIHMEHRADR